MVPKFKEKKAAQIAAQFLVLRGQGGIMSYMKLIKLMYLVDREALLRWGWSMTGDEYCSMKHGQVLSNTLDLLKQNVGGEGYWKSVISAPFGNDEVKLLVEIETDELSKADVELIDEIFGKFGRWKRFDLADYTHRLSEYRDTNGPSLPVGYGEVLRKNKQQISDDEVEAILNDLHSVAVLETLGSWD